MLTLKNKRANYFANKMSLFGNSKKFIIWDKPMMTNHRQVWRTQEMDFFIEEGENWGGLWWL